MVLRFKGNEKSKLLWLYFAFSVGIEEFLPDFLVSDYLAEK